MAGISVAFMAVAAAGLVRRPFTLRPLFMLLAAVPVAWLVLWSLFTLYMEGVPTYFTYYLICAAPAAVFCFFCFCLSPFQPLALAVSNALSS